MQVHQESVYIGDGKIYSSGSGLTSQNRKELFDARLNCHCARVINPFYLTFSLYNNCILLPPSSVVSL